MTSRFELQPEVDLGFCEICSAYWQCEHRQEAHEAAQERLQAAMDADQELLVQELGLREP